MEPGAIPPPAACVFDLDGTLVDSLRDIAEALNDSLALLGLPPHPVDRYRYMVGEGIPKLVERAAGPTHPHLVPRLAELAGPAYRTRVLRHTAPYPGIIDCIRRLAEAGLRLAVLSNKPHALTVRIVRAFWPSEFAVIHGYVEERHRKPSPYYLLRICAELGVLPQQVWLVGDTATDMATARAGGAVPVGVTWGFRPREELRAAGAQLLVDTPADLARAILSAHSRGPSS